MPDPLDHYRSPGPFTGLSGLGADALAGLPADPNDVATVVQGLVVHPFLTDLYGTQLGADRIDDQQVRPAADGLARVLARHPGPLVAARDPGHRLAGTCRTFTTVAVALLRHAGVPARARCGFASYFQADRWVDHWVVEHHDGERWVRLDAQVDDVQRRAFDLEFDPTDVPARGFLAAGEAWQACQEGREDGDAFGILDEWGQWFIRGNVARDLAALNKVELLPWDGWGDLALDERPPGGDAYVDEVAALLVADDHDAICARYEGDPGLKVPPRVLAMATPDGPTWVDLPELA
ncbi:MAG: transglutaminase domain-containing protein [Actinobacteria bacterium]|nr:transglutaminase domain-containing protein [Actinomycetota bacterium]